MKELRQSVLSYPSTKGVMGMQEAILSQVDKEKLKLNIKIGIYKDLKDKSIITDSQFQVLVENLRKNLTGYDIIDTVERGQ